MLFSRLIQNDLLRNPEYQSALVRLAIWFFSSLYIGFGAWTDYYAVDLSLYYGLFGGYFVFFVLVFVSVYLRPVMGFRTYLTLAGDVSATSCAIYLTHAAISPFFLLYIWIFVSYGTRYGKRLLMVASLLSVSAYSLVLLSSREWQTHTYEVLFFLFLLIMLPLYQYSLLRKLHSARQEAERANKARGDFLATMTHELRTPLIGILGIARLMEGTPLDGEQKEYLHAIDSSAQLLRALIGDILDFSKIDAGKLELLDEPFEIRQVARSVVSVLAGEAQEMRLELRCWVDPKVPKRVRGDHLRITQILFNLLGNAIKFTERGSVMLRIGYVPYHELLRKPHVLIEIEDTGIGISQDDLERIFDRFWQFDTGNGCCYGGTGLGTTIARNLSRCMGGEIRVRSQVGSGSTFSVHLPLLMGPDPALPIYSPLLEGKRILIFETDEQNLSLHLKVVDELGMQAVTVRSPSALTPYFDQCFDVVLVCDSLSGMPLNTIFERLEFLQGQPMILFAGYRGRTIGIPSSVSRVLMKPFLADDLAEAILDPLWSVDSTLYHDPGFLNKEIREPTGIRILLAEDNAIAAKVLSTLLLQRGHSVFVVKDGIEALEALAKGEYHLAFVDLRMPRMDGIEFVRRYRSREVSGRHLPIYALTANTVEDVMAHCLEAGMDGFLTKPVEPEQLEALVGRYVMSQRYRNLSESPRLVD